MLPLCDSTSTAWVAMCVSVSICVCVHLTHELHAYESKGHLPEKAFIAAARYLITLAKCVLLLLIRTALSALTFWAR